MHLLPEEFGGAEGFTGGAVARVVLTTETCIGQSVTGPGQGALERAAQVVKGPRYDDVIVETHQRGHTEHPNANTYEKWQERSFLHLIKTEYELLCQAMNAKYHWSMSIEVKWNSENSINRKK